MSRRPGRTERRLWLRGIAGVLVALVVQTAAAKPRLLGLVYMGDTSFHRSDDGVARNTVDPIVAAPEGAFLGVVVNATWAQLQPGEDQLDATSIDSALASLAAYNRDHPRAPLRATLRVWPGPNAPDWAKRLDGPPVHINHVGNGPTLHLTIGRVWAPRYRAAWRKLQDDLAARYDDNPLILEASATSCSTITNESVLLPDDAESIDNLHKAGFTDAMFRDCLKESPADYAAWRDTAVDFYVNPYREIDSGSPKLQFPVSEEIMRAWREAFGSRVILANAALLDEPPNYVAKIQSAIRAMGPPIAFQMYSPDGSYYDRAVRRGVELGASEIEVWGPAGRFQGFTGIPPQQLRDWNARILGGSPPADAATPGASPQ